MTGAPWILITISGLIMIAAAVAIASYKNRQNKATDYYTLFIIGLTWIPLGIALDNSAFFIIGLAFMAIGLKNKDKWKENHKSYKDLDIKQKRIIALSIGLASILLMIAVILFIIHQNT